MKESIGYTVSLNIIITFIIIIIAFLSAALIYFKSNKVSNVITETIEKYEGYNVVSKNEITMKLSSLGYNRRTIKCAGTVESSTVAGATCGLVLDYVNSDMQSSDGYCVYMCNDGDYYYYKIRTNMILNIPIINEILNIPIFSNTNRLYNFSK